MLSRNSTADKAFEGLTAEMFTPQQLVVLLWAAVDIAEPVSMKSGKSSAHDLKQQKHISDDPAISQFVHAILKWIFSQDWTSSYAIIETIVIYILAMK